MRVKLNIGKTGECIDVIMVDIEKLEQRYKVGDNIGVSFGGYTSCVMLRGDKKGLYFMWGTNKVYINKHNWTKITFKDLNKKISKGEYVTIDEVAQAVATQGVDKSFFDIQLNYLIKVYEYGKDRVDKNSKDAYTRTRAIFKLSEAPNREVLSLYKWRFEALNTERMEEVTYTEYEGYCNGIDALINNGVIKLVDSNNETMKLNKKIEKISYLEQEGFKYMAPFTGVNIQEQTIGYTKVTEMCKTTKVTERCRTFTFIGDNIIIVSPEDDTIYHYRLLNTADGIIREKIKTIKITPDLYDNKDKLLEKISDLNLI